MKSLLKTTILFLLIFTIHSCTEEVSKPNIKLEFKHNIDGDDLTLHYGKYLNESGESYDVRKLMYLISDVKIENNNGDIHQLKDVHFVRVDENIGLELDLGETIPTGQYTNITFTFGLDEADNISNKYLNDPFHLAMVWPDMMGGGYHYMKLEGAYHLEGTTLNFYNTHTGKFMESHRHIDYDIPIDLNITNEDATIMFNMNINEWYRAPNTYLFEAFDAGIMANDSAQALLMENGNNAFNVTIE